MKRTFVVLTLGALVVSALTAWAQGWREDPPGRFARTPGARGLGPCVCAATGLPGLRVLENLSDDLALTDEQREKIKALAELVPAKLDSLRQKSFEAIEALRKALYDPQKDAAALKDLAEKAQKAENALASAQLDLWTQLRSILTAEQLKNLGELMSRPRAAGPPPVRPDEPPSGGPDGPPPPR